MKPWLQFAIAGVALAAGACGHWLAPSRIPDSLWGEWRPLSRALQTAGPMTVSSTTIEWPICQGAMVEVKPVADPRDGVLLALGDGQSCTLNETPISHLRIVPRADTCGAELFAFTSARTLAEDISEAWGLIEKTGCGEK